MKKEGRRGGRAQFIQNWDLGAKENFADIGVEGSGSPLVGVVPLRVVSRIPPGMGPEIPALSSCPRYSPWVVSI